MKRVLCKQMLLAVFPSEHANDSIRYILHWFRHGFC